MGLGQFDDAKKCSESLGSLGEKSTADCYLKKLAAAQERDKYFSIQFDDKEKRPQIIFSFELRLLISSKNYLFASHRNSTIRMQNRNR